MNFTLTDILGKKIDIQSKNIGDKIFLDVSILKNGFYILKFENGIYYKFLKE